jgi:hypothetical protein
MPSPIPLWPDKSPKFADDAAPETVDEHARIRMVSVPTISVYLPPKEKSTGMAIIICPGGGYGGLDWKTHVVYAAEVLLPKGGLLARFTSFLSTGKWIPEDPRYDMLLEFTSEVWTRSR